MYELKMEEVESVTGGHWFLRVLRDTAIGEGLIMAAQFLAEGTGEAGGPSTGGYGDSYHGNLPPGMQ